jgi:Na+/alanine symporter
MNAIVDFLNSILWGYVLVYGLLGVGVFFTIRLGFLQFLNFGEMLRVIKGSRESDKNGISPFQALCTSLASRVGTGNLAGVAVALYLGGAGAIFWMWMVALVGMATINLVGIVLLSGTVVKLTKDYFGQRKQGDVPKFRAADYPELNKKIDNDIWR